MGMARSKINRDQKRISNKYDQIEIPKSNVKLLKANLTIKRLKCSLSNKDKKLKESYSLIKVYEEIIDNFNKCHDYTNSLLKFNNNKIKK